MKEYLTFNLTIIWNVPKKERAVLNGEEIQIVRSYVYLGVTFSSSGVFSEATDVFIKKTLGAQACTLDIIRRGQIQSMDSIGKIFDSMVQSVLLYAGPIWALNYLDLER